MKKMDKLHLLKDDLNEKKEKKWDNRFITLKISEYDAYKDVNYLSLGLIKSKIRYEEKQLKESQKKHVKQQKSNVMFRSFLNPTIITRSLFWGTPHLTEFRIL